MALERGVHVVMNHVYRLVQVDNLFYCFSLDSFDGFGKVRLVYVNRLLYGEGQMD